MLLRQLRQQWSKWQTRNSSRQFPFCTFCDSVSYRWPYFCSDTFQIKSTEVKNRMSYFDAPACRIPLEIQWLEYQMLNQLKGCVALNATPEMQISFHTHNGHQVEGGKEPVTLENS